MSFLLRLPIFRGYVKFPGCMCFLVPQVYGEDPLEPGEVDRVRQSRPSFLRDFLAPGSKGMGHTCFLNRKKHGNAPKQICNRHVF